MEEGILFGNVHVQAEKGFTYTNAKAFSFAARLSTRIRGPALTPANSTAIDSATLHTGRPHPGTPLIATHPAKRRSGTGVLAHNW